MSGCAAVGCSNRGDKGFFMKSFPRDPERRALWASRMNRESWQPNNNSRICEVHFDNEQWEKTRQDGTRKLKCNAVPTLFQNSKQRLKRKGRKPRFIVPLTPASDGKSEASESFEKCFENTECRRMAGTDELENKNLLGVDSEIKSEGGEEKKSGRPKACEKMIKLTSFCSEAERIKCDSWEEGKSENLEEERESKAYESSSLQRSWELSVNTEDQELETIKTGDSACCRLCANRNGKNYIPIFGESDLAEKISRCLPIIVLPADDLPLQICQQCLHNLNISYKLIIGSLKADSFLRSEFSQTNTSQETNRPAETPAKELSKNQSATKEEPVFRINGPIKCDLCDDLFKDMNVFDTHIETTHLLQWRCSLCDHSFETSQELMAHKTLNHSGQILTCQNCLNSDSGEEADPRATERVEGDGKTDAELDLDRLSENECPKTREVEPKLPDLNCTKCKINFDDAKQFRKHHTIHLPRRIKCSVCCKRCPSIFDYLTHVRVVHNQIRRSNLRKRNTVHGCKYCKKVFLIRQQLIVHLRKHKKEMLDDPSVTVYKCVTCPKKFVDRALYQKHRNVHDPACWHKFRCYICNRSFMDRFKLKIHQSIHDGVKPYQCDVCGRMFNRNANMIRHRAKHFEQTCRHCEKTFSNTQSLREHLKDIHGDTLNPKSNSKSKGDGNKTNRSGDYFVCGYCGKQLTSYYSLLDHERIHTGDKPYVCQNCGKAFRSLTARWDHMVRHEKGNYVCELCGKIMSNKLNLRRHLRKHAAIEQRRFECKECGKLFHVRWRLNAHLIRIHHSSLGN